ncbi:hypothetical protein PLIIFM63780_004059 [Purpureocillium lilacinum]|nr:hypothetical protein PLICBS_000609 [Purpureocillium lilacinum]GJN80533.1 hypothetical protein PLIIFM63780_004059 [Purpureocillium lilacinum]
MPPLNYIRTAATEGPVARTEIGSPVQKANLKSVGLGVTTAYGRTQMESGFARAMTYAGASVPKVRTNGEGWIGGEWHVVTSDGGGPVRAIVDTTAKGDFRQGIELENLVQVPGQRGEIRKQADGAGGNGGGGNAGRNNIVSKLFARFALQKRADNINQNFEYKFRVPRGLSCTGTVGNATNVCVMNVVNTSPAGPFGNAVVFQSGTEGQNSTSGTAPGDNNNGGSTDDNSLTGPAKDTKGPASPAPGADNGSPNGGNKSGGTDDNTIDGGGNNNKNGNDKLRVRAARRALPVVAASGHHSEGKGHSKDKVRRFFTA